MNVYPVYLPCCSSCNRPLIHIGMDIRMALERGEDLQYYFEEVYSDLRFCCRKELMSPSPLNLNIQSDKAVNFYRIEGPLPTEREGIKSDFPRGYLGLIPSPRFEGALTFVEDGKVRKAVFRPSLSTSSSSKAPVLEEGEELILDDCDKPSSIFPAQPGVPIFPSILRFTPNPRIIQGKVINCLGDRTYLAW